MSVGIRLTFLFECGKSFLKRLAFEFFVLQCFVIVPQVALHLSFKAIRTFEITKDLLNLVFDIIVTEVAEDNGGFLIHTMSQITTVFHRETIDASAEGVILNTEHRRFGRSALSIRESDERGVLFEAV